MSGTVGREGKDGHLKIKKLKARTVEKGGYSTIYYTTSGGMRNLVARREGRDKNGLKQA